MKAKKKEIDFITPEELSVEIESKLKVVDVSPPEERSAGVKVESVAELVDKLRNEAKVI